MEAQFNTNQIYSLMNESTLSDDKRKEVANKFQNIINAIKYLNTVNSLDNNLKNELENINTLLAHERKTTAKVIVAKNNSLSKTLIKSMAAQKENLFQMLEVSQLRIEAELKKLNQQISYPAIKTEQSIFNKLFSLFKIPFRNISNKKTATSSIHTQEKIKLTTSKLTNLEKRKEDLVKEFEYTGNEALKYINKITYSSLLPAYDTSTSHLENLKNKITFLDN